MEIIRFSHHNETNLVRSTRDICHFLTPASFSASKFDTKNAPNHGFLNQKTSKTL